MRSCPPLPSPAISLPPSRPAYHHPEYWVYLYLLSFRITLKKNYLSVFLKEAPGIHSPPGTARHSSSPSLCCLGLGLPI